MNDSGRTVRRTQSHRTACKEVRHVHNFNADDGPTVGRLPRTTGGRHRRRRDRRNPPDGHPCPQDPWLPAPRRIRPSGRPRGRRPRDQYGGAHPEITLAARRRRTAAAGPVAGWLAQERWTGGRICWATTACSSPRAAPASRSCTPISVRAAGSMGACRRRPISVDGRRRRRPRLRTPPHRARRRRWSSTSMRPACDQRSVSSCAVARRSPAPRT